MKLNYRRYGCLFTALLKKSNKNSVFAEVALREYGRYSEKAADHTQRHIKRTGQIGRAFSLKIRHIPFYTLAVRVLAMNHPTHFLNHGYAHVAHIVRHNECPKLC